MNNSQNGPAGSPTGSPTVTGITEILRKRVGDKSEALRIVERTLAGSGEQLDIGQIAETMFQLAMMQPCNVHETTDEKLQLHV